MSYPDHLGVLGFFSADVGVLSASSGTWRTTDRGNSWAEVSSLEQAIDLQVREDGTGWATTFAGEILRTSDFGETWISLVPPVDGSRSLDALNVTPDGLLAVASSSSRAARYDPSIAIGTGVRPDWRVVPAPVPSRIWKVRLLGDELVVGQAVPEEGSAIFHRHVAGPGSWERLETEGSAAVDFELFANGLAVLTRDGGLWLVDEDLVPTRRLAQGLDIRMDPSSQGGTSARGDLLVLFDVRQRLLLVEGDEVREGELVTLGEHAVWEMQSIDRAADGSLVGITQRALYRSRDAGLTWHRLAGLGPFLAWVFEVRAARDGALVWGRRRFGRWSPGEDEVQPVPELDGAEIAVVRRYGETWLAAGAWILDEAAADRLRGVDHVHPAGDWLEGAIFGSADAGDSWTTLARWPGGLVQSLHLTRDGSLAAYRAGGGFRRGPLEAPQGSMQWTVETDLDPADPDVRDFGLDWGLSLYFSDARHGWLAGHHFFSGASRWITEDGGRTWKLAEHTDQAPIDDYFRLGEGRDVLVQIDGDMLRVSVATGNGFEPSRDVEGGIHDRNALHWAHIDAGGGLLVPCEGGALWRLSPDGETWTDLRPPQR